MFSHVHIKNGTSIVHSHLGGGSEHDHSDSQYAVIDILSDFQSEGAAACCCAEAPFHLISKSFTVHEAPAYLTGVHRAYQHRGPPQC